MHGTKDPQVPLDQSERLSAKLKENGVPVDLVVLEGAGHGGKEFTTAESPQRIKGFFDKNLNWRQA